MIAEPYLEHPLAPRNMSAHELGAVEGSKGINIKTRGLLERNRSAAMYIMYQDLNGLPKKIPYRQAKE